MGYDIFSHTLSNGLEILFIENHKLPLIAYFTFYKVGSRNERPGITGISHLFEHLMFKGSDKFPEEIFDQILTTNGGYSNAYTTRDMTVFYEVFPKQLLETVIDMESDRMKNLNISEESLESERQVVIEERLMRTENSVEGELIEQLYANSYLAHPYSWPVIGWMSDIQHITLRQCLEYHKIYYAPNNAVIVVSGDINRDETIRLIESYYSSIPAQVTPPAIHTKEPLQSANKYIYVKREAGLQQLYMGYLTVDVSNKDLFALDIMQIILCNGNSSRLHKRLVEEDKTAVTVGGGFSYTMDPGLFIFHFNISKDQNIKKVEQSFDEELEKLKCEPVDPQEVQKARNLLKADYAHQLSSMEGRGHEVGKLRVLFNDPGLINNMFMKYDAVTAEDIQRVAGLYFAIGRTNVILDLKEN